MIDEFITSEKSAVDEELKKLFHNLNNIEQDLLVTDFLNQLEAFIIPANNRAKRINAILLIASFKGIINPIYLGSQIEEIRKVSLAVELLHNGHVIHDDLIDDDIVRRGVPTFHIQLKDELNMILKNQENTNKEQLSTMYGRDMSILGGSYGYMLGLDVIKNAKFPENLKIMAINEYIEALNFLMKGQIVEAYMEYNNITMTLEQYLNLAEMLKARLFEKSVKIGAILARGNLHYQIKPLSEAMIRIGQAYAIRDDILDVKSDIKGKKKRFPYILSLQNTDEEQSRILNEIYHKKSLSKTDVKDVEKIFAETNSIVIAEHFSKNLIEQAKNYLKDIYPDLNKEEKLFFNEFCDYIYMRDY